MQGFDRDYARCFMATVASEADRDTYSAPPDHQDVIALSRPQVAKLLVLD